MNKHAISHNSLFIGMSTSIKRHFYQHPVNTQLSGKYANLNYVFIYLRYEYKKHDARLFERKF